MIKRDMAIRQIDSLWRTLKARRREVIIISSVVLVSLFLLWLYWYLRPNTWHYYTDEISLRQLAKKVRPRFILWEDAKLAGGDFNKLADECEPAISPDGVNMVFSRGLVEGNANLFISRWDGQAWSNPEPVRALNSNFNEVGPSFSEDGKYLFFATDRPGGPGGYDIWVSRWDGAEFAWPLPLTIMVNSKFDELGPCRSGRDGKLYFSSNHPRGPLSKKEAQMPAKELHECFKDLDHDIFVAHPIPAGVTNREVERAQSMLYFLRESALADQTVMAKLGGSGESEVAVSRALEWLATNQETNGNWSIVKHGGQEGHDVAATSFTLLTYFGRSERYDRPGKYQETVSRGLKWLLSQQNQLNGDMRGPNPRSNSMYDHSIATLALAEGYGLTKDENLLEPAQSAVDFLVDAQNENDGGWRYSPKQAGDMSVSGWAIMALKNAELSGLYVPQHTYEGVRKWLKSVSGGRQGGLYGYQGKGGASSAMIATGYFCSQLMGLSPNTLQSFETADKLQQSDVSVGDMYYAYYGTLCSYQNQGPFWRDWKDKLYKKFLAAQQPDGSWNSTEGHGSSMGRVICTSLIALSLEAHYRYTPLYGLGYEPSEDRNRLSTVGFDQLSEMPLYRHAKRMQDLSSPKDDVQVCVTDHGDYLYFASDRAGGLGGFDIYRSRITDKEPLPPENLGPAINSSADELGPASRMAGFNLLFTSNRGQQEKSKHQLYSALSRRVYQRHDYSYLPALGWMLEMFRWRLALLVIALIAFLVLVEKYMKKQEARTRQPGRSADLSARDLRTFSGMLSAMWVELRARQRWFPAMTAFAVMIGLMLSIFFTLRQTIWCYYTNDTSIRRDANNANVRFILWEDPYPTLGSFNVPSNRIHAVFSPDGASMVFDHAVPGSTNIERSVSVWDGRIWSDPEPAGTNIVTAESSRVAGYSYFESNMRGGLGGLDIYCERLIKGKELRPENLGAEINSKKDDAGAAVRMEGFDLLFSSNRGQPDTNNYVLYSSTAREVIGALDLTRWYSLTALLGRIKWWVAALVSALMLLIYLLSHWKDLTSLFHKCLAVSAIVHLLLLLITAFWIISVEISESMEPKTMEVCIDVDVLAKEKLALDMQEKITELPMSPVNVLIEQTREPVPMPEFTPPKVQAGPPIVTKSSDESFVTKVTPSKAAEEPAIELASVQKFETLPELEMPDLDLVMEVPEAAEPGENDAKTESFQPVVVQEKITVEHQAFEKRETKPVTRVVKTAEVASGSGTNNATGMAKVRDTGGDLVVASAGLESRGALPQMSGSGDLVGLLANWPGSGKELKINAPGKLDLPESLARGATISPEILRNPGKLATETVEGLGGNALTQGSIAQALDWFTKHQEPDGCWDIVKHGGEQGHDVAATSLILLCYYGWGAKHNEAGSYQGTVKKAIDWLVSQMKENGDFCTGHGGNGMYDQGMATMALCEAYGLTKDKRLHNAATNTVAFLIAAQDKNSGGWRYQPRSGSDTSVFGWEYMALKSAELAGLETSSGTISNALVKADKWLDAVGGGKYGGIYGYQGKGGEQSAMIATGMFCRQLAKMPPTDARMMEGALHINVKPISAQNLDYYYLYYGTLALYQHQGPIWDTWNERMKQTLPELQHKVGDNAGSWGATGNHGARMGRTVATALATLSLEVYYRILPIYGFRAE